MKIIFFCGSLEPGRDGVGDYTRRLAGELIRQGHSCATVALMDKGVSASLEEVQTVDSTNVFVLRLPFSKGYKLNCMEARTWVDAFNPDWISLQYVPFSFHHKGLPFGLGKAIQQLIQGRKLHIMFHEMWVGISVISPFKHKITGFFQHYIAKQLVNRVVPSSVTTSNILYQLVLENGGIVAKIIPLFSSISKVDVDVEFKKDLYYNLKITEEELNQYLFIGVFGFIYPEANIEKVLNELLLRARTKNEKLVFVSFGRIGTDGEKEIERLSNCFSENIQFINYGVLSEKRISTLLQLLDIGISCTPSQHLGKSSIFAAMKFHGLEVLMSCGEEIPEYEVQLEKMMPSFMNRSSEMWSVENVVQDFISLLNK